METFAIILTLVEIFCVLAHPHDGSCHSSVVPNPAPIAPPNCCNEHPSAPKPPCNHQSTPTPKPCDHQHPPASPPYNKPGKPCNPPIVPSKPCDHPHPPASPPCCKPDKPGSPPFIPPKPCDHPHPPTSPPCNKPGKPCSPPIVPPKPCDHPHPPASPPCVKPNKPGSPPFIPPKPCDHPHPPASPPCDKPGSPPIIPIPNSPPIVPTPPGCGCNPHTPGIPVPTPTPGSPPIVPTPPGCGCKPPTPGIPLPTPIPGIPLPTPTPGSPPIVPTPPGCGCKPITPGIPLPTPVPGGSPPIVPTPVPNVPRDIPPTTPAPTFGSIIGGSQTDFFDVNVCHAEGITINKYIPKSVLADLEQKYREMKCKYLRILSSCPRNIGPVIHEFDELSLEYHTVIVGIGPGALGAVRKLVDCNQKVLLLDRGNMPPQSSISLYSRPDLLSSEYVIPLSATAPYCNTPKTVFVPNVVGGSSTYDSNSWIQGSPKKFNNWSSVCKKWSYEKVTTYYKKVERVETTEISTKTEKDVVSSQNGIVSLSRECEESKVTTQVRTAFTEIGITKEKQEVNQRIAGFTMVPFIGNQKQNVVLANQVLEYIKDKENVDLALNCITKKIIFESGKAVGLVVQTSAGTEIRIKVRNTLILGQGPIDTVRLLSVSGAGDSNLLNTLGIPVQIDLPYLGKDFLLYPTFFGLCMKFPTGALIPPSYDDYVGLEYMIGKEGISPGMELSYHKAYLQIEDDDEADVMVNFYIFSKNRSKRLASLVKGFFQFSDEVENFIVDLCENYDVLFPAVQLIDVESKGSVSINSASYDTPPVINTGMYEHEKDMRIMMRSISVIQTLAETQAFKGLNGELVQIPVNQCGTPGFNDEYNKCSLYALSVPNLHPCGGAIMGNSAKTAVVDENLKIFGSSNVHCFSSAVIPFGGDSAASACMIGNYGASMLGDSS